MLNQMKKPILEGFGRRNDTLEAIRIERALKRAADEKAARVARARPQAVPMAPGQRELNYYAQAARSFTPAQRRRAEKKERRVSALVKAGVANVIEASGWRSRGSVVSTATGDRGSEA